MNNRTIEAFSENRPWRIWFLWETHAQMRTPLLLRSDNNLDVLASTSRMSTFDLSSRPENGKFRVGKSLKSMSTFLFFSLSLPLSVLSHHQPVSITISFNGTKAQRTRHKPRRSLHARPCTHPEWFIRTGRERKRRNWQTSIELWGGKSSVLERQTQAQLLRRFFSFTVNALSLVTYWQSEIKFRRGKKKMTITFPFCSFTHARSFLCSWKRAEPRSVFFHSVFLLHVEKEVPDRMKWNWSLLVVETYVDY